MTGALLLAAILTAPVSSSAQPAPLPPTTAPAAITIAAPEGG